VDRSEPSDVAAVLDSSRRARRTLDVDSVHVGDLAAAYAVQRALTSVRIARGDTVVGWKLGYTTAAMREQMEIDAPNYGPLLASMDVSGGGWSSSLLQPRIEPEIALVLASDPGTGASVDRVLGACARACLALEVVDSVWTGYRFDLEHNTADGSSAAGYLLGTEIPLDAGDVAVVLQVVGDAARAGSTTSDEGLGSVTSAAASVAWLADRLAEEGARLRPGDVVLTGGLTRAQPAAGSSTVRGRATFVGGSAEVVLSGALLG
jgi:2-keto-4-pentenoate hydratase